jgi:hypothetical protein
MDVTFHDRHQTLPGKMTSRECRVKHIADICG